jgi:hypothetical protein
MSWGEPKALSPFPESSPFYGLAIPEDVTVESQVMAQPDPQLSERTIASLTDGTPLVTRAPLGQGSVVLFHVTANADWSSLPLSGSVRADAGTSGRVHAPRAARNRRRRGHHMGARAGAGRVRHAARRGHPPRRSGRDMVEAPLSAELLPGLYAGGEQRLARNVVTEETELSPGDLARERPVEGMAVIEATDLMAAFLVAALALLLIDALAALWLAGRLSGPIGRTTGASCSRPAGACRRSGVIAQEPSAAMA